MQISLLIISNGHNLLGSTICELLSKDSEAYRISLKDNYEDALIQLKAAPFSLVINFVTHPLCPFLTRLERLRELNARFMLVFNSEDKFAIRSLVRFQADGLISTDATYQEFRTAIHTVVLKKLKYISPLLITAASVFQERHAFSNLSRKELDVALSIMGGKRNCEMAAELNISPKTVSTYKARIYKKLQVKNDLQLYIYAQQSGN